MAMREKKGLKHVQIDMKRFIIIFFIVILGNSSYAQKKVDLSEEDEKIQRILSSNRSPISYPDSIAMYNFYIKITPQKNGENNIYINNALGKKVFGNLDSIFHNVNFSLFLEGTKQKHVIIPVGILVYAHPNMKPGAKLDILGLKDGVPKMMGDTEKERYKSVFLRPFFMLVGTLVSH